ncbi:hypothetical protein Zmor_019751 [Zophobas morio]|uniref:Uncharacterized protein n=1 Tax=Zophobas morio TaxID=2755281 RepID=A0AA38M9S3_9CUCU|nr:hypothetical protein Zmor_019751 [Zophobas morio]
MAWQKVSEQTIANCFRHAEFLQCNEKFEPEDELLLAEWLKKHESNSDDEFDIDFREYVHFDDILVKSEILDDDIVESVQCNIQTENKTEDEEENEEEEKEETIPKPSHRRSSFSSGAKHSTRYFK